MMEQQLTNLWELSVDTFDIEDNEEVTFEETEVFEEAASEPVEEVQEQPTASAKRIVPEVRPVRRGQSTLKRGVKAAKTVRP